MKFEIISLQRRRRSGQLYRDLSLRRTQRGELIKRVSSGIRLVRDGTFGNCSYVINRLRRLIRGRRQVTIERRAFCAISIRGQDNVSVRRQHSATLLTRLFNRYNVRTVSQVLNSCPSASERARRDRVTSGIRRLITYQLVKRPRVTISVTRLTRLKDYLPRGYHSAIGQLYHGELIMCCGDITRVTALCRAYIRGDLCLTRGCGYTTENCLLLGVQRQIGRDVLIQRSQQQVACRHLRQGLTVERGNCN